LHRLARGLLPVLFILAFTFVAHALTLTPRSDASATHALAPLLAYPQAADISLVTGFAFSPTGALDGLFFVLRIVELICATTLFTLTSPIVRVSDAIASLLRPLRVFRVPVEDIAMMFSIALRFIPLTAEEAEKVIYALAARGVRFGEGGLVRRLRAYQPLLVPLFVGLFRRADALAVAMESRCYDGANRTRLATERLNPVNLVEGIAASVVLIVLGLLL
jgi:energy-coupling factor transport system permease protein